MRKRPASFHTICVQIKHQRLHLMSYFVDTAHNLWTERWYRKNDTWSDDRKTGHISASYSRNFCRFRTRNSEGFESWIILETFKSETMLGTVVRKL